MVDWAVTFLVRGEEGIGLAERRARTILGRDATDQVTADGTEVTLIGTGFLMGEALDQARRRLADAAGLTPGGVELLGAARIGGRYLVGPRAITVIFRARAQSVNARLHCIDTTTGAIGLYLDRSQQHLIAFPEGSGADREYEYERGGIEVTPFNARCQEDDQRPEPFATVADAVTDGRLAHLVFNGSHFTLCGLATDTMRVGGDPTIPHCQTCADLAEAIGPQA